MSLQSGTRFGPYEILAPLGSGAMGEVYRARDSRLGREAAIKVLPPAFAADPESLRRFEKEARAASALNHPNIVTVYDVGFEKNDSYIAMELIEGRNLRELSSGGPLPLAKLLDVSGQVADGLAAAHARGLVHRDLKPQNVLVTKEGRVKILDFGLAKQGQPPIEGLEGPAGAEPSLTTPGAIVGTVGYMSPEQARGEAADYRSDQFSLGVILYELATGKKAFDRGSAIETLSAILRDEPELGELSALPGPFCWIVERCLAKEPEGRYASTRGSGTGAPASAGASRRGAGIRRLLPAAALVAFAAAALLLLAPRTRRAPPPSFEPLTFRRGTVWSARFAPDGRRVLYAGAWDGEPFRLFVKVPESPASGLVDFPEANLMAVSRSGEVAAVVRYVPLPPGKTLGMLVRGPIEGGSPREVEADVLFADFTPDGRQLAVVRRVEGKTVLEFPIGARVYETDGAVTFPRVSPKGDLVAFLDHPVQGDSRGTVATIDRSGRKRVLSAEWADAVGLAWHPRHDEIWFAATDGTEPRAIRAVALSGKSRVVARAPGNLTLQDIAPDGRVLVTRENWHMGILGRVGGAGPERDLTFLNASLLTDLSRDGKVLLFTQFGEGVAVPTGYLRRLDEANAKPIPVGEGWAQALSPDGSAVLSLLPVQPPQLRVIPTGAGQPRPIVPKGLAVIQWADWFPDGRQIALAGAEQGGGMRLFRCDPETGATAAITPEGSRISGDHYQGIPISPDGTRVAAVLQDGSLTIFPTAGGPGRPVPGLPPGMVPIDWTPDGRELFVFRWAESPARILRVNVETGEERLWREIALVDPAGSFGFPSIRVSRDGGSYAYTYARFLSELYAVSGLD
jgi:predicted Ser/Thr protein kinase